MAVLLTCKDLHLEYPAKTVLDGVTLGVNDGDRIGIVGRNGDGKSSLLRVLAGTADADSGQVIRNGSATIGLLAQSDGFADSDIVEDIISGGKPEYLWAAQRKTRTIVDVLLADVDRASSVGTLSGGQRRRVDLARLLIGDWDILMLDEPTNHLDLPTIWWLADHLKSRWQDNAGALLMVTHDRWFLDEVCGRMWEVHDGAVDPFEGGYSAYIMQRVERDRLAAMAEQKRQNEVRKELAWLSRGAQARRSKPRFHIEAAQALIADVPPVRNPLELKQMAMQRLGKQVVDLYDVCLDRGGKQVLRDITWMIGPGDRIGILGANGAGKSSLLDVIRGALKPTAGHVKIGKTVKFALLSQNLAELAPFETDVVRVLLSRYKTYYEIDGKKMSPTALLERLGFSRDQLSARVSDLSGGQRRRLQLLLILLDEPNVLILDEPGNDLDTDMLAVTEDLLDSWPGTLIVVSHDRYFTERVCDDLYALLDGDVQHMPGGVDQYLRTIQAPSASPNRAAAAAADAKPASRPRSGPSNAERHALKKRIASLDRKMDTQRSRVEELKAELLQADPTDFQALGDIQADIQTATDALDALETEWLDASEMLEA